MINLVHPAIARAQAAEIALAAERRRHPAPPRPSGRTPIADPRGPLRRLGAGLLLRRPAAHAG
jgi:hypothetical protein